MIASDSSLHQASFDFEYDDQRTTRLIERSIRPEIADMVDGRSKTAVSRDGTVLSVRIEATDLVALRAAMNTWLTLLATAETVVAFCDYRSSSNK